MTQIDYFYSTHSVYAYLGHARLLEICEAQGCRLVHRPFLLSPAVEASGSLPFVDRSQPHVDYFFGRNVARWASFRGVPISPDRPTHHDNPLTLSSGMIIAAQNAGANVDQLALSMLRAHWCNDIDLMDPEALKQAAEVVGIDATDFLDVALSDAVQAEVQENTEEAIRRSVFGSPTYFLEGDMYYGQDHLELLEAALKEPDPAHAFRHEHSE